jgi:hypothetical protein
MNALNERNVRLHDEDYPLSLSPEQIQNPVQVIRDFYEEYDLMQAKNYFWEWLHYLTSDEARPFVETQTRLRIFGASLLRLIDAAWVTLKHKHPLKFMPLTDVQKHIEADRISFLSKDEIEHPQKVINSFFQSRKLNDWHYVFTFHLTRCLQDSHHSIYWALHLEELPVFYHLFRLLESLNIVAEKTDTPSAYAHWCYETQSQLLESVTEYSPAHVTHKSLANLWHSLRYSYEWHPLLSTRFKTDLTTTVKTMHAASHLLASDGSRMYLKNGILTKAALWSPHETTRLIVLLITESPPLRSGRKREADTPDKIEHMETTLQLLANYLQYS